MFSVLLLLLVHAFSNKILEHLAFLNDVLFKLKQNVPAILTLQITCYSHANTASLISYGSLSSLSAPSRNIVVVFPGSLYKSASLCNAQLLLTLINWPLISLDLPPKRYASDSPDTQNRSASRGAGISSQGNPRPKIK